MKARVTFIYDDSEKAVSKGWDPSKQISVKSRSLELRDLQASTREDHLTLGVDEVPKELWDSVLRDTSALHVRWQSPRQFKTSDPYGSRITPGLHVFYTPARRQKDASGDKVCNTLRNLFNPLAKCETPSKTFNTAPILSKRFSSTASLQYYQECNDVVRFADYVSRKVCSSVSSKDTLSSRACAKLVKSLQSADAIDIDYTAVSSTVTLRSITYLPPKIEKETIDALEQGKVEVGILSLQASATGSTEGEDAAAKLSLGGLVTVVGEDSEPSPVLFSFPSRHHSSSTRYAVSFNTPTGLHPTMRISFPGGTPKPPADTLKSNDKEANIESSGRSCALHASLSLPSKIFPDKYQLTAPNFLAANNLRALRSFTDPPPDLEAPDWAVDTWGSNMLMELAPPSTDAGSSWDAQIPLHLRYLRPAPGGQATADVPWPTVFWACTSTDGTKMGVNPFDRDNLGYDGAFGPRTVYYHLTPDRAANSTLPGPAGSKPVIASGSSLREGSELLVERISVPVLDTEGWGYDHLRAATAAVMLLGLVWVAWKLVYVTITNREAGGITKLAQQERVDGKKKGPKKD